MTLIFSIIGLWCLVAFIIKFVAILFISVLNKRGDKMNPIYYLSCDKCFNKTNITDEIYFIPTIGYRILDKELTISVKWFKFVYYITYYYKHADDV